MASSNSERDHVADARRAAEDLFRPKSRPTETTEPRADGAAPTDEQIDAQPVRKPRVFEIPAAVPTRAAEPDPIVAPPPDAAPPRAARKAPVTRRTVTVSAEQHGRIKALATYGMSVQQVADLYGLSTDIIERIVKDDA